MAQKPNAAMNEYNAAVDALCKFCEKNTELECFILCDEYPVRVQFLPKSQISMFGDDNVDENGEVNDLVVTVGLTIGVKSTLKFRMDSKILKKLIKLAETVGSLYYQSFREQEGKRITPIRPFMKPMEGFTAEEASELVCPCCVHPIVNQWAPGTKPNFCQGCGQAINWTPEPETDKFQQALDQLREIVEKKEVHDDGLPE